jgi:RNA polymerase sigma-70 factor (TIGR02957 family)
VPPPADTETFEAHRDLMFAVAYRMLGTVADAEDAVQDAWLRWSAAPRDDVADPRAYLIRVITNTSLNRLRAVRARREAYIGPWLPEPLFTRTDPDSARVEVAESVSLAMLVVMESLTPDERAVFVLREVFGYGYAEIGAAIGHTEVAARQIGHRAREHVHARRPRFEVDRDRRREVTERFLDAAAGGDIERLIGVLAPEVVLTGDGGGQARNARRPVVGSAKVARLLHGLITHPTKGVDMTGAVPSLAEINGGPGVVYTRDGQAIVAVTWVVTEGLVVAVHIITNPGKLAAISSGRVLIL